MILIVLDGWGLSQPGPGNAVAGAKTPVMDDLVKKYPCAELYAHGEYVGLAKGQAGNSEAGHMNIGAGRVVEQDASKITKSINNKTFFKNPAFIGAVRHAKKMNSRIHVMGMLSNGQSPHSDPAHLSALLELLRGRGARDVYLHLFTDGRDSPQYSSLQLVNDLEKSNLKNYKIATIMGRFYAMDRKKKWERTEKAYGALVKGEGRKAVSAGEAITESYNRGESDEFVEPYVIERGERMQNGDSVIFFNLRSDRARQLAKAFAQADFNKMNPGSFARPRKLNLYFVAMTDFGPDLDDIMTAYPGVDLTDTLPMVLKDLSQLYIAESEKYAHVTYFFNGGYAGTVNGEDQFMIKSPDVKSYDEVPAMSSRALTRTVLKNLEKKKYDFTVLNFAAPDMIGHTGNFKAGVECCAAVDECAGEIVNAYLKAGGTAIITADHGNVEEMVNLKTGEIDTEHSTNRVPFIIAGKVMAGKKLREGGALCDIAPTVLKILGRGKPKTMTGKPLIA